MNEAERANDIEHHRTNAGGRTTLDSVFPPELISGLIAQARRKNHCVEIDSLEGARRAMATFFVPHRLDRQFVAERFGLHYAYLPMSGLRVGVVSYDDEVTIQAPPPSAFVLLQFTLEGTCTVGNGERRFEIGPDKLFINSASRPIFQHFPRGYRQLNVWIDRRWLGRLLANELGAPADSLPDFPATPIDICGEAAAVPRFISFLCREAIADMTTVLSDPAGRYMAYAFMSAFMTAIRNPFQELLARRQEGARPPYLRRAESFVRQNSSEPITLADIIAASGVSQRTLHYAFSRYLATTPLAYLKNERLLRAREALLRASPGNASVTQIALASGFNHLSKFAVDYRSRFGEAPSQTLMRQAEPTE
jgi:AraC-like DNA-binding protein